MRLFIAIETPPDHDTLKVISAIRNDLYGEKIKWVDTSSMHITLKFLGETDEELLPDIQDKIAQVTANYEKTRLSLQGIGVFPNVYRPRVLWMGVDADPQIAKIAAGLEESLADLGFEPETREFKPHLTLGRIKFLRNRHKLQKILETYRDVHFQDIDVDKVILFRSTLTPQGPVYTVIREFPL